MKITKEASMTKIRQAFNGFHVEFIDEGSTAIRARVFFDDQRLACINLLPVPRSCYETPEKLAQCIDEIKIDFDARYAEYLNS